MITQSHGSFNGLRGRVLSAYGGAPLWRNAAAIEARLSTGGPAFWSKGSGGFRGIRVRAEVAAPAVRFARVDDAGNSALFTGDSACLESPTGRILAARTGCRELLRRGRRRLYWDLLDCVYFTGYAAWNYLMMPALLLREDIEWRELSTDVLEAAFPDFLPTHCSKQTFRFDPLSGLLLEHRYTAEVISSRAAARNIVLHHEFWNGIPYPSLRKVYPARLPFPCLVWIKMEEWRLS